MTAFENATKFFHACEGLKGWDACSTFAAAGATFEGQCEPLEGITTVEGYVTWWTMLGHGPFVGVTYSIKSAAWDEANRTALFFAVVNVTHAGEGGPVPPTGRSVDADYVYAITMDEHDKVKHMVKVWNAPWSLRGIGWM
jgi:hypothetical protein